MDTYRLMVLLQDIENVYSRNQSLLETTTDLNERNDLIVEMRLLEDLLPHLHQE